MTQDEAQQLVAKLFAAFPDRQRSDITAAVYVEQLMELPNQRAALEAVNDLIASEKWLPKVAEINEAYDRARERARQSVPALREPAVSDEQRAENMRRVREYLDKIGRKM